jgi:hypothetical protein
LCVIFSSTHLHNINTKQITNSFGVTKKKPNEKIEMK